MTNLQIKIIDTDHKNKVVEIEQLSSVGLEILLSDAERLVSELKDKFFNSGDDE